MFGGIMAVADEDFLGAHRRKGTNVETRVKRKGQPFNMQFFGVIAMRSSFGWRSWFVRCAFLRPVRRSLILILMIECGERQVPFGFSRGSIHSESKIDPEHGRHDRPNRLLQDSGMFARKRPNLCALPTTSDNQY